MRNEAAMSGLMFAIEGLADKVADSGEPARNGPKQTSVCWADFPLRVGIGSAIIICASPSLSGNNRNRSTASTQPSGGGQIQSEHQTTQWSRSVRHHR
jgi:hypothetical protein